MRQTDRALATAGWPSAVAALSLAAAQASAATLRAVVEDRDEAPVEEVVVYATPIGGHKAKAVAGPGEPAIMDQRFEQFTPHILVTQTGNTVSFPNNDTVSHHVYSFSEPKTFELPLYQGSPHPPITFDQSGVVDVGCNIHDHMEAHIVVVDTPYFAITGADGRAELAGLPEGEYAVRLYTPRLRARDLPEPWRVTIGDAEITVLPVRFDVRLRPAHTSGSESLTWHAY